ncbi:MAG: esterase-like activity of phytase family protein, partial [Vicinamibacterales bacterium]
FRFVEWAWHDSGSVIVPAQTSAPHRAQLIAVMVAAFGALVGACAARQVAAPQFEPVARGFPPLLTWLGEYTRPMGARYPSLPDSSLYGSISGLVRDGYNSEWVGVIDERENSRVVWLAVSLMDGQLSVTPSRLMALRASRGVPERLVTRADLEAITMLPDGTFLMIEEGHVLEGEVWEPAILQMTRDGLVIATIRFPKKFQLRVDQRQGVRDNQGFESLTRTPMGRLIAGLEQPLIEDGPLTSFDQGAPGLLVEFLQRGQKWVVGREWRYPLDPTPRVDGFESICDGGENGLVELLAISETELFSMERACLQRSGTSETANAIRIFNVELSSVGARKTLLLDLSTLAPRLSPALERLDNFEALSFGPSLANGSSTLLVVSDDNFRATQKTSFLLFGLR